MQKKVKLAEAILEKYRPESVEDLQDALKDIFGPMYEAMLQGEMNQHLGIQNNDHAPKETTSSIDGYVGKTVRTTAGKFRFMFLETARLHLNHS